MLSDTEYQELATFRYQIRSFLNFSEEAALQAGVEPRQHQALLAIRGGAPNGACTVGTIAKHLFLQHQSAVGLVDRLVARGLVRRAPNPNDGRQVMVHLTAKGDKVLQSLTMTHGAELKQRAPELARALRAIMRHGKGVKAA